MTDLEIKAHTLIPGGTSSRSRKKIPGVPMHVKGGQGAYLEGSDGIKYLDMRGAQGTNLLGYGFLESHSRRLQQAFQESPTFSLTCEEEVELAEMLLKLYTGNDMVRFFKTGGDASSAAVRLARAATGNNTIISCGYHGWHDQWGMGNIANSKGAIPGFGIPSDVNKTIIEIPYGDTKGLRIAAEHCTDLAAIITVPLDWDCPPNFNFIQEAKQICQNRSAALIFDDVFCGFRLHIQGGTGYYGVEPDMICLSKALSSGYPLSCVVGKKAFLENASKTLMSSTYATDKLSIVAAIETLHILLDPNKKVLKYITDLGENLTTSLNNSLVENNYQKDFVFGLPAAPRLLPISRQSDRSNLFAAAMFKERIICNGIFLLTFSHSSDDIDYLQNSIVKVLKQFEN